MRNSRINKIRDAFMELIDSRAPADPDEREAYYERLTERFREERREDDARKGRDERAKRTCVCGHIGGSHPFGLSEALISDGRCWQCDCREFRARA